MIETITKFEGVKISGSDLDSLFEILRIVHGNLGNKLNILNVFDDEKQRVLGAFLDEILAQRLGG